ATSVSSRPARVCTQTTSMEGTGSRVSQVLVLQEGAQVGTVPVDGIGHHPADGQAGSLGTLDHLLAQFGFGRKADRLRNMSGLPPGWVGAPVFWQIQCAVDEGMPLRRGVGEQALHAIGMGLPSLFSELPAIFAGHVTEDSLQIAQGLLMDFGAREKRAQSCMQLTQLLVPPADLPERGPPLLGCGMLKVL